MYPYFRTIIYCNKVDMEFVCNPTTANKIFLPTPQRLAHCKISRFLYVTLLLPHTGLNFIEVGQAFIQASIVDMEGFSVAGGFVHGVKQ